MSRIPSQQSRARPSIDELANTALEGCRICVDVASVLSPLIPIPGVVLGIQFIELLIRMVDMMHTNAAERATLLGYLRALTEVIQQALERLQVELSPALSHSLTSQLEILSSEIRAMAQEVTTMSRASRLSQLIHSQSDADRLLGISARVQQLIEHFKVECLVELRFQMAHVQTGVDNMHIAVSDVQTGIKNIQSHIEDIHMEVDGFHDYYADLQASVSEVHNSLHEVHGTVGDIRSDVLSGNRMTDRTLKLMLSKDEEEMLNRLPGLEVGYQSELNKVKHGILQGTRDSVLKMIDEWKDAPFNPDPKANKCTFILSGVAGCGKSTIAYTIAEMLDRHGLLAGSYFFSRDDAELSNIRKVVPSLTRQVATSVYQLRSPIVAAIKERQSLGPFPVYKDFDELLIKPLSSVKGQTRPLFVVIDAVDECLDREGISELLHLIYRDLPHLKFPLRFIITGRPDVQEEFTDRSSCILHELDHGMVLEDLVRYLVYHLGLIRDQYNLPADWPPPMVIPKLSNDAGGLFIYLSTGVAYLKERDLLTVHERLDLWLNLKSNPTELPQATLDKLYGEVLDRWSRKFHSGAATDRRISRLLPVLAHIVLTFKPLSPPSLATLLSQDSTSTIKTTSDLKSILHPLSSVIVYPSRETGQIKALHASFADLLRDKTRCSELNGDNSRFYIDPVIHHSAVASSCLKLLSNILRPTMLNIINSRALNSNIPNLANTVSTSITEAVRYACSYGIDHVVAVKNPSNDLLSELTKFARIALIPYVEAMSLLGQVGMSLEALGKLTEWYHGLAAERRDDETGELFSDCQRLVSGFFDVISASAGHVNGSALNLAPDCPLRQRYFKPEAAGCSVIQGRRARWSDCLRTISYNDRCRVSIFSPDESKIASGLFDGSIVISNAITGEPIKSYEAHPSAISSLAYAPDGTLVSGSWDGTVRKWNPATGKNLGEFTGSTKSVYSISVSPDGRMVAAGSSDSMVRVWDYSSRQLLATLEGHNEGVLAVSFSPDGQLLASGSGDKTIRLWDVTTWQTLKTLQARVVLLLLPLGERVGV